MDHHVREFALRLGDDALILAQRLAEWSGRAPTIEVDLSLSNIALDLLGQSHLFLDYAAAIEGGTRDADTLAFHRDAGQFRNCLLAEQPNGDFGQTMVRQFLFSTWQKLRFEKLAFSDDAVLAGIAAKAVKEIAYHVDIAGEWLIRLGDGTDESHGRAANGVQWMWRFVPELFEIDAIETELLARDVAVDPLSFKAGFDAHVAHVFGQAKLEVPALPRNFSKGRSGHHSEHLGPLLATMQHLPRSYPDARW